MNRLPNVARFFVCAIAVLISSQSGYSQTTTMTEGVEYSGRLEPGGWKHYRIYVSDWDSELIITLTSGRRGNPDVYVRKSFQPTLDDWDFRPYLSGLREVVTVDASTTPRLGTAWYYVSVRGRTISTFRLSAELNTTASTHTGMGAIPYEDGTAFRVWAPNADSVNVAGQFNSWSSTNAQLVNEGNGFWSLDHRNANPGQQYKYVIRNGNQTIWNNDPREEQVTNSVGNTVIFDPNFDWTDNNFSMAPWNELVIYEMHVGTLNDQPGGGPGTFDSAIGRLDHIQAIGANAVSIMPVNEFAGDFSWGYNQSYPFSVESAYGGPRALKRFVDAAHARGIAVFLDLVHNHYGPSDLDLWRFDGWFEGNRGGIYFYQDDRANTQWGDTRPDFGRPEVRQYIRDNYVMWLTDFHVDGFRTDSTSNIRTTDSGDNPEGWSLMQWINDEINIVKPGALSIAEDLQNNAWITRDTGAGGAGFDTQWNAQFIHPIRDCLEAVSDNDRDMWDVRNAIAFQYSGDAFERVIYTESHDEVANGHARVPEDIWPGNADSWVSRKRSTLGGVLVMTSPGIPMIFQGQEILEDGYFQDTDPVDWSKEITHAGIKLLYTDLIHLRRNWYNQTRGLRGQSTNVFHVNDFDKVIAFHRWQNGGAGDDVIVVCNFSANTKWNYRIGLPRDGVWKVRFNSDWNGYSSDFGNHYTPDMTADGTDWDGLNYSGELSIAPYSAVILSQD
jgi:1,4-alpha-glucan branching enzyme